MTLKDWPPQRIKRLWLRGLALESALVLLPIVVAVALRLIQPSDFQTKRDLPGQECHFAICLQPPVTHCFMVCVFAWNQLAGV